MSTVSTLNCFGTTVRSATLQELATGTGNGSWTDVRGLTLITLHVKEILGSQVRIQVSNDLAQPADATAGITSTPGLAAGGADQMISVLTPVKWIKADIITYAAADNIRVYLEGM